MTKSAIIYARYSPRRNADQSASNQTQIDYCTRYAKQNGYTIRDIYTDTALSGADEDRPGLYDALTALQKDETLLVYNLSRLSRDTYLAIQIERKVANKQARIVSTQGEGTATDNPQDQLIRRIIQTVDEYQRKVTQHLTRAAMRRHQRNGRKMSHKLPYGFTDHPDDPTQMIPEPTEQATIARMKNLRATGATYRHIAQTLNQTNHLNRNGRKWTYARVHAILQRENH